MGALRRGAMKKYPNRRRGDEGLENEQSPHHVMWPAMITTGSCEVKIILDELLMICR
jgi:hypothetical protein